MQFHNHRLANGLEIVAECNPQAYSAAYGFFVRTGSRDESDEVAGVSHFLEHMVFKGTPARSAAEVNLALDELASQSNAYTSEEQTVYYATTLPEDQEPLVDLLADIMRPALREDDFQTEKQVILEEIAKYEDQPPYNAHEKLLALLLGNHPLSRSVLGSVDSITALSRDQMLTYFQRRYSPGNIVFAAGGAVDFDQLVRQLESTCGQWEPFDAPRQLPTPQPNHQQHVLQKPLAAQQYVVLGSLGPGSSDEDRYAARVLTTILGDESGSRLFWELIDTGEAEYAALSLQEFQGLGVYMTSMSCSPEDAATNIERIRAIYQSALRDKLSAEELLQAQNKICAHVVLQAERPTSRMFSVGNGWIQRQQYRTVREGVAAYRKVTLDDLHRVLTKYPLDPFATIAIGPTGELN